MSVEQSTAVTVLPDEDSAPEEGSQPKHHETLNNLAGDKELADAFWSWSKSQYQRFASQPQRKKFCGDNGTMDQADRMYRMAERRDTTSDQHQNTKSNMPSSVYFRAVRMITTSLNAIFFDKVHLPAKYEPEVNTTDFQADEGTIIAEQRNLLQQYTFDEDKRRQKCKDVNLWAAKYGITIVSDEWDYRTEEKTERVVTARDSEGRPTEFNFEKKKRVIADWPSLSINDVKDCFFDAQIEDESKWRAFFRSAQDTYEHLANMQENGQIMNVGKITSAQLYQGDNYTDDVQQQRHDNADEDAVSEQTGLVRVWHCWGVVPIREMPKRKGRGKWEPGKVVPSLYWGLYAAADMGGPAVPLLIVKNPNHHGKLPYKKVYTHKDNKGAYHMGFPTQLPSHYYQAVTNINQANDNVNMRNNAPMTINGPVHTSDLTWRSNKVINLGRGTVFERQEIPDTTAITMPMVDWVERDVEKTTGADQNVQGQIAFARTSATQVKQDLDQALQPIDEMADYIGTQFYDWLYEMDAALWDQYADPDTVVMVSHQNQMIEVRPAELWGPVKIKVTAVSRFRNNTLRRQEVNSFIQNALPLAAESMGPEGRRNFFMDAFDLFGFDNTARYFPSLVDIDARERAIEAIYKMTQLDPPQWTEPQEGQNHPAWLTELKYASAMYARLPQAERNEEGLRMLQAQIQLREQLMQNAQAAAQQQTAGGGGGLGQPQLPGQATGQLIQGEEGAVTGG